MKTAMLLHNPTAGDEEHSKEELISLMKESGFEFIYSSTKKKGWKEIDPDVDFLIAAGGDGTVRKIIDEILDRKVLERTWPIAVLPLGTANNIARSLGISGTTEEIIRSWHDSSVRKYDVGRIYGLKETKFFMESMGYGIFPYLMLEMHKQGKDSIEVPSERLNAALELLHQIVHSYDARDSYLEIDGKDYSGSFLLLEIMNIPSIGPNLILSPNSDPGDGELEVVVIGEEEKDHFATHVLATLQGATEAFPFRTIKGKNIVMRWDGTHVHVDDKTVKAEELAELKVEIKEGLIEFLIPRE